MMSRFLRSENPQDRRHFSRVLFDAQVELAQGSHNWRAKVLDISLKGLLLHNKLPEGVAADRPILVKILLADSASIAMSVLVVHQHEHQLGLTCTSIDIDSMCHLRRLLEFNLGNAEAAEREVSELIGVAHP